MKAKFVTSYQECSIAPPPADQTETRRVVRNGQMVDVCFWKLGGIVEHPEAYLLCQHGIAEPADDECRDKCGMSTEQMAAAQHAAERARKGIRPEDFARYDAGEMDGYNPDGSDIPGPNGQ